MLDYKINLIKDCNINIFEKIYELYCIYNEDRTKKDFLNEIIIDNFYKNIIIIYDKNEIVGYSLIKIIEEEKYITYIYYLNYLDLFEYLCNSKNLHV